MSVTRIGVYPGSFDPVTNGHVDIIRRATHVVDHLILGVAESAGKVHLFSAEERVQMLKDEVAVMDNVNGTHIEVMSFNCLLMDFVCGQGASVILRGLRAVSDFEYEFQMAGMNSRLQPAVETLFLMASEKHQFIASRFVKEVGRLGGDIGLFVPPRVKERLLRRFSEEEQ